MSLFSWKRSGFIILALIITMAILLGTNLPGRNRLIFALQDSGHFIIFFLLTVMAMWIYRNRRARTQWLIMLLLLLFGVLVEVMQSFVGREPSLYDLWMDLLGILAGGSLYAGFIRCSLAPYQSVLLVLVFALVAFYKPLYWIIAYQVRSDQFPRLFDSDSYFSRALVEGNQGVRLHHIALPRELTTEADLGIGSCVYVPLQSGRWPGVELPEPEPDWRGYTSLEVGVYSYRTTDLSLTLRIDDVVTNRKYADRYNGILLLKPGYNHLSLQLSGIADAPKSRRMQMEDISRLILYAPREDAGSGFCLLSLELR